MNLYLGNLSYDLNEDELKDVMSGFGEVEDVKIIKDKFTGKSRGFGFVTMPNDEEAKAAIDGVTEIKERPVTINEARPQTPRAPRGDRY